MSRTQAVTGVSLVSDTVCVGDNVCISAYMQAAAKQFIRAQRAVLGQHRTDLAAAEADRDQVAGDLSSKQTSDSQNVSFSST
jgi:hypothetical protein